MKSVPLLIQCKEGLRGVLIKALCVAVCVALFHPSLARADEGRLDFALSTGIPRQKVFLAADFLGWRTGDSEYRLREVSPGNYALSLPAPLLPAIHYKFVVDGQWQLDPSRPDTSPDGQGGYNSRIVFANYRSDPYLKADPTYPWTLVEMQVQDFAGSARTIYVVDPPGLIGAERAVTVYFQDGGDYLLRTGVAHLLARLSREPGMPRFTGVFVPPRDRMNEYIPSAEGIDYARFLAERVVPSVESRFKTGGAPSERLIVGASLGGLIAVYTALIENSVFTQVAAQSGSFWIEDGSILGKLERSSGLRLRVFMEVGVFEGRSIRMYNRRASRTLMDAGHSIHYRELSSIHSWISWRERLQEMLRYFFPNEW